MFFAVLLSCPVFSQNKEMIPFQEYEPAYIHTDSMLKYQGKLARWENGWLYTKDVLKKKTVWKKTKKLKPRNMMVRIFKGAAATLHEIPVMKDISITKNGKFMAFTVSFGGSSVTSVGMVDLIKNLLVYVPDLKQKSKDFGGSPQLVMENVWFNPSVTEDGKYMVCDGFKGTGARESALINIVDKKIEKLPGVAMPVLNGNRVFMWEKDNVKKRDYIWTRQAEGGEKKLVADFNGTIRGMEALIGNIYVITPDKIFSFDAATGEGFAEIHDFSYLNKGYDFMSAEKTFSAVVNGKAYIFLALKRVKEGKYDWQLFGLQVE